MNVPDPFSVNDWMEAGEMHLRCEPRSDAAAALVGGMVADLPFAAANKPVRPSTIARRRRALGALLADLLKLQAAGLAGSHGMERGQFPAKVLGFAFDIFAPLKDAMVAAGLLHFRPGKQRLTTSEGFGRGGQVYNLGGWVARFRLTPLALEQIEAAGVSEGAWSDHWQRCAPLSPDIVSALPLPALVGLKASNVWEGGFKQEGKALPVHPSHPMVQASVADLEAHNAFMHGLGVEGIDFLGLRRLFNEGDKPDKLWRSGGRFYSLSVNGVGSRYENMSGNDRRASIRIGGRPVGEVDMSASQLRLLYALQDVELRMDLWEAPYDLTGLSRDAVKLVVAQALGKAKGRSRGWGEDAKKEYAKRNPGRSLPQDFDFATYQETTLAAHPILETLGQSGVPGALELQFVESEVIRRAMADLRAQGIGSLPIHDSLLAAVEHLPAAKRALEGAFTFQVEMMIGYPSQHHAKVTLKAA